MFGKVKTADEIVEIFTKTVAELRKASDTFATKANEQRNIAAQATNAAESAEAESAKATRYAQKISTLFDDDDTNDAFDVSETA